MKTLIIIPAYNEEKNIKRVIEDVVSFGPHAKILVIDDGSSDRTGTVARETKKADIITLPHNLGIGGAVQTGFKYARRNNYDVVVRVDGDGQHRADQIKKILQPILERETDVTIGSRFLNILTRHHNFIRRIGQKTISSLISLIIRQNITDATSGFRCYNKYAIELLNKYYPTDYPEPEEIIFCKKNNLKIKEVGILMKEREKGTSSLTAINSVYYMIKVILSIVINILRTPTMIKK